MAQYPEAIEALRQTRKLIPQHEVCPGFSVAALPACSHLAGCLPVCSHLLGLALEPNAANMRMQRRVGRRSM